jgi:membrane associated rhomboid family serine protease
MLPLLDVNPTYRVPILTILLMVLNAGIFIYQQTLPNDDSLHSQTAFVCEWGLVPDHLVHGDRPRAEPPGQVSCEELNEREPRGLALVTSQFLHGSWLHLLGNMLFLWVFGNNVEDRLGRIRFLPFYILCGAIAALVQALIDPSSGVPLIGASGAIAGVMGAYIVLYPRAQVWTLFIIIPLRVPAWVVLGLWFVYQFVYGAGQAESGGGVAYWAHVGGFIAGALLILPCLAGRPPPPAATARGGPPVFRYPGGYGGPRATP